MLGVSYTRKADVFNRGYSGYNTRQAVRLLASHVHHGLWPYNPSLPSPSLNTPSSITDPIGSIVTIFFGANDASLLDSHSAEQYVEVGEYSENTKVRCRGWRKERFYYVTGAVGDETCFERIQLAHAFVRLILLSY